jgi:2-phosphosulfolactate phosphatase
MGEVGGLPPAGFDLGNSPSALAGLDLTGRTLIHRTSAGTQGPVRARRASALFGASFVVAAATARAVLALRPTQVTLVVTGARPDDPGDEDWPCAEYLAALLRGPPEGGAKRGEAPDPASFLARARRSLAAEKFLDPARPDFPLADLDCCLQLDRFDFAMPVERSEKLLLLKRGT